MNTRRKAREAALQALYQCDTLNDWSEKAIETYFKVFQKEALEENLTQSNENLLFAKQVIAGVIEYLAFLDQQISAASTRWSLGRMSRVDRNILRLATYEIAFLDDIPTNVSINEAIEIAKRYGTDDSPMFVNGVLDNLASVLAEHPEFREQALMNAPKKVVGA